jgi:predicted outer membrane lipoprotein
MVHLQQQLGPQFAGFPPGKSASKFAFGLVAGVASEVVVAIIAAVALDHWDKNRRRRRAASSH